MPCNGWLAGWLLEDRRELEAELISRELDDLQQPLKYASGRSIRSEEILNCLTTSTSNTKLTHLCLIPYMCMCMLRIS